jgi:hypothetical protein
MKTDISPVLRTNLDNLRSPDGVVQHDAFMVILEATDKPVDWAYEVWDEMVAGFTHKDNHVRAIAAQVICNLAKSDPQNRMLNDFGALLAVTRDPRFVTARHCMQALWKVGVAGKSQREVLVQGLEVRFKECITEKNCTLIRYDILQCLRNVYDVVKDETVRQKALAWMEIEEDPKYKKKYASLWKVR